MFFNNLNIHQVGIGITIKITMFVVKLPSGYLTVRHGKSPFLIGKPSISGAFSMAMLVITRG